MRRLGVELLEDRRLLDGIMAEQAIGLFDLTPAPLVGNQARWADEPVRYAFHGPGANAPPTDTGTYDGGQALIIDPALAWSTYLGGSGEDWARRIAADTSGNVLVTGSTESSGWTAGGFDTGYNGGSYDAFVAKLAPGGAHLWSSYLGGTARDEGHGIAVDGSGNVLVAGYTGSSGWTSGGFDTSYNGGDYDAFVAKLSPTGAHLWSTYLGGSAWDCGYGVAVDTSGNVLVTGYTWSSGWTSGGFDTSHNGSRDAFVAMLSPTGAHIWSTYLGGTGLDQGYGIAADTSGNVLVTGESYSSGWTSVGFDTSRNGSRDAFVAKLSPTGTHLWSTYLGGIDWDCGEGIAVGTSGNVLVTGWTESSGWTSGGFDPSYNGGSYDAFVANISATGAHLWSTYLGGTSRDKGRGIAVGASGNALVTGHTASPGWTSGGFDTSYNGGGYDAFVVNVSPSGAHLWSAYLGGTDWDYGSGIAVDTSGNVLLTGNTWSPGWTSGGFDTSYNGGRGDAFVAVHIGTCGLGANDDEYDTDENTPLMVDALGGVLANDVGSELTVIDVDTSLLREQLATWDADGSFTYDPNGQFEWLAAGKTATETFSYTVSDGQADTDTATVTITVTGVNDAPTLLVAGDQTADKGAELSVTDVGTFTDPDFDHESDPPLGEPEETFTYTIDWGDGTAAETGTVTIDTPGSEDTPTAGSFDGAHTYASGGVYTVAVTVDDGDGGVDFGTFEVTVYEGTFRVVDFAPNPSGFDVQFNRAADLTVLNLYDGMDAAADSPDVVLVGNGGVDEVRGSLIWDAATNTASFVKTGGVLAPATYTVTLVSAADAWRETGGGLLDGEPDSSPGGNYTTTFTVVSSGQRVVSLPDFARGATSAGGQPVDVPATGSGLPIRIDEVLGVQAVDLEMVYDPALLHVPFDLSDPTNPIRGAELAPGMPGDWSIATNLVEPGLLQITISGLSVLPAGGRELILVDADVPAGAPYGASQVIRLENLELNGGLIGARADRAVHKAAFFGDADGGGFLSGSDAGLIARAVALFDGAHSGFDQHDLTDPVIVADVTGTGMLDGLDAGWVAQKSVDPASRPEIPDVPAGPVPSFEGPDPQINMPADVPARPGETVVVPINLDGAAGLYGFNVDVDYDTSLLDVSDGTDHFDSPDVTMGSLLASAGDWQMVTYVDDASGQIHASVYRAAAMTGGTGPIAEVAFTVKESAMAGITTLVLSGPPSDQYPPVVFTHVDGSIKIGAVVGRHVFYNNSGFDGRDPRANQQDDNAIAADKHALEGGQTATFANYTSYSRGINGIMVDIVNPLVTPTADAFEFHVGNSNDPDSWPQGPNPSSVTVRESPDNVYAERVTIIWDDYAIHNQWLQVTVRAGVLGLSEDDVFYFGSAVGESGNSATDADVNHLDVLLVQSNPHNFFNPATVTCPYDFNRDGRVNATDELIARSHQTDPDSALKLLHPPASQSGGQDEGSLIPASFEEARPSPAMKRDLRLGKWAWLWEFEQMGTNNRSSQKRRPAAEAVDKLLAEEG